MLKVDNNVRLMEKSVDPMASGIIFKECASRSTPFHKTKAKTACKRPTVKMDIFINNNRTIISLKTYNA